MADDSVEAAANAVYDDLMDGLPDDSEDPAMLSYEAGFADCAIAFHQRLLRHVDED